MALRKFSLRLPERLFLIGLVAVMPALAIIASTFLEQRALALTLAEQQTLDALREVARAQDRTIDRVKAQVVLLSHVAVVRTGTASACNRYLANLHEKETGLWATVGAITLNGRVRCSSPSLDRVVDLSDRAYFQAVLASRRVVVGSYLMDRISGEPAVIVAGPIIAGGGNLTGVLGITIKLSWMQQSFSEAAVLPGTQLALLDRDGTVLAHFPAKPQLIGQPDPRALILANAAANRSEGVVELEGDPDRLYVFYRLSVETGPAPLLYAAVPKTTVYDQVEADLARNLIAALLVVTTMLVGSLLAGQRLVVRPVRRLEEAAQRLAGGDLAARAGLAPGRDEIASLGTTFDSMAARLQEREAAVRAHEATIKRINRVYAVLSSVNGLIIRAQAHDTLLTDAARIAVDQGGYPLAWVGLLDPGQTRLERVESADEGTGAARWLAPPVGLDPGDWPELAPVFNDGRTIIHQNPSQVAGQAEPPSVLAAYSACAVIPLKVDKEVVGCISLYAAEANAFNNDEMRLLQEMAADISHSLAHLGQAERLAYMTTSDLLTGLPNLERFRDRLAMSIDMLANERGGQLAVMLVGVQGLRDINSAYGLHLGDQMLRALAERLQELLPSECTIGRLRGDVFGVIVPQIRSSNGIDFLAGEILTALNAPVSLEQHELQVAVRMGISLAPGDGVEAGQLIQYAETALNSLHGQVGRFRFYQKQLQHQAEQRLSLEHALLKAVDRDELYLLYQPIVAIESRTLTGVEALVRWRHPSRGEILPGEFIPIAEASGMMPTLGEWILHEACRQTRAWTEAGAPEFRVSVNVAPSQLRHEGFLESINTATRSTGVNPRQFMLALELTETELMEDAARATELLAELKEQGFALSIDDFGTGYSSLAYLRRFPLDTLKIDTMFIRDIINNAVDASIVQAIIALARALQLNTIAEGVETEGQFEMLRSLGCNFVQGYLFRPPVPAEVIPDLAGRRLSFRRDSSD